MASIEAPFSDSLEAAVQPDKKRNKKTSERGMASRSCGSLGTVRETRDVRRNM